MGLDDKIGNSAENLGGKAKEAAGDVTGNEQLEAEGKGDQAKSKVKDAVEDVKDKASEAVNKLKGD
ncbi:CsbD family protein [Corynebacterium sputi]|uniref:CsbD family protein n=1 Tax=Corynebacterium sputi TaxID=489915 RepID=UPI000418B845|nr:CsbD family protein [Corynebacterium sputi]